MGAFYLVDLCVKAVRYPIRTMLACANDACQGLVKLLNGVCVMCPDTQLGTFELLVVTVVAGGADGTEYNLVLSGRETTRFVAPTLLENGDVLMSPLELWRHVSQAVFPEGTLLDVQGWYKSKVNPKTGFEGEVNRFHVVNWKFANGDWPLVNPDTLARTKGEDLK